MQPEIDYARFYTCLSHTPRDCWDSTPEDARWPLVSDRIYAPLATMQKLAELRGADGDYHQALQKWYELPEIEKAAYPWSSELVPWDVPKEEWRKLTYCYRDRNLMSLKKANLKSCNYENNEVTK